MNIYDPKPARTDPLDFHLNYAILLLYFYGEFRI